MADAAKPSAGKLRQRIAFDVRGAATDDYGNTLTAWAEQFVRAAEIIVLRGGESVQASRLEGTQPVIIRVRYDAETATIAADWRARDTRSGIEYAISAPPANIDQRRQFLDILATQGKPS